MSVQYKLDDLQDICLSQIENNINASNAVEILKISDKFQCPQREYFKERVIKFIKTNIEVANTPAWKEIMVERPHLKEEFNGFSL